MAVPASWSKQDILQNLWGGDISRADALSSGKVTADEIDNPYQALTSGSLPQGFTYTGNEPSSYAMPTYSYNGVPDYRVTTAPGVGSVPYTMNGGIQTYLSPYGTANQIGNQQSADFMTTGGPLLALGGFGGLVGAAGGFSGLGDLFSGGGVGAGGGGVGGGLGGGIADAAASGIGSALDVGGGVDMFGNPLFASYGGGVSGAGSGIAGAANPGLGLGDLPNFPTSGVGNSGNGAINTTNANPNGLPDLTGQGGAGTSPGDYTGIGPNPTGASNLPSWLSDLFPNATTGSLLTGGAKGLLDYLASNSQQQALQDQFNKQWGAGEWARQANQASYAPGFNLMNQPGYGDAFQRAADISGRAWSAKAGNPAGSPTAQAGIMSDVWNGSYLPALTNYRGGLLQAGGQGLNTSGQIGMAQAQQAGAPYSAIGTGIGAALNPPQQQTSLAELLYRLGNGSTLT